VAPISPTPSILAADASQVDKDASKSSDDVAVAIYDKKV
jgi:hypothetical protein